MQVKYSIPSEFTDEDVWFRFFHKKNLAVIVCGVVITFILWKFLMLFGIQFMGLIIGLSITVAATAITMIPTMGDYLKGGTMTLDILLARRHIRKKKKAIYVRGYGKDL